MAANNVVPLRAFTRAQRTEQPFEGLLIALAPRAADQRPRASFAWRSTREGHLERMVAIADFLSELTGMGYSVNFYQQRLDSLQPELEQFAGICPLPPETAHSLSLRFVSAAENDVLQRLFTTTLDLRSTLYLACRRAEKIQELSRTVDSLRQSLPMPRRLVARREHRDDPDVHALILFAAQPELVTARAEEMLLQARTSIESGETLKASRLTDAAQHVLSTNETVAKLIAERKLVELVLAG